MGGAFKIPYLYASPAWPRELHELREAGFRTLALHLKGSVEHRAALPLGTRQPTAVMVRRARSRLQRLRVLALSCVWPARTSDHRRLGPSTRA